LFKTGEKKDQKADIEVIREKIAYFDKAHYDIMTCSEDEVNFRIFRVMTKKFKNELGDQALKLRDLILEKLYEWCNV
jgi:hypothetical protein